MYFFKYSRDRSNNTGGVLSCSTIFGENIGKYIYFLHISIYISKFYHRQLHAPIVHAPIGAYRQLNAPTSSFMRLQAALRAYKFGYKFIINKKVLQILLLYPSGNNF